MPDHRRALELLAAFELINAGLAAAKAKRMVWKVRIANGLGSDRARARITEAGRRALAEWAR